METKRILGIIFSIIFLGAFAFVLSWGIINFNKVKDSMSGTQIYDSKDLSDAYQDGYDTALKDKNEYTELINGYRDTITTLTDNISKLNSQIAMLTSSNKDYENQVTKLENQKDSLQYEIDNLNSNKVKNETTIANLNSEILELNTDINNLNQTIKTNENTILGLNTQINGLNLQISGLNESITNNEKTIRSLRIEMSVLNSKIGELSKNKVDNENSIAILQAQIRTLDEQIVSLSNLNKSYSDTIDELNAQIKTLSNEKNNLIIENTNYYNSISSLNNQIINLQNINSQLENTNVLHQNTISSLNSQIATLNEQISSITLQGQNNNAQINALNNKIIELQESINYYERYIASMESEEKVVATFEFDGSVYNIQIVNKNSLITVTTPASTDYVIFNGWKVGDELIDLTTYSITTNTKFVADITYRYDVKFVVDGVEKASQIVTKNETPNQVQNPSKAGYEFDGWSIDGTNIVDPYNNQIIENTTYIAVFTKLHTVKFVYENETKSTQTIRNGEYATDVNVDNTNYKVFNGWKVNGSLVTIANYKITSDTIFVADLTYKYDVIYMIDGEIYNSQIVAANNYPKLPTNPTKVGYEFDGWSINGETIINTSTMPIVSNVTYVALFTKLHKVEFEYEGKIISSQNVRNNSVALPVTIESTTYKVFNNWLLDGEVVDIKSFKINSDVKFVAYITYKYDVKFIANGQEFNTQIVTKDSCAIVPNNPTLEGYEFDGWSVDNTNIVVNINSIPVVAHTTYYAIFTKLHTVKFIYENEILSTQIVRNNSYAKDEIVSDTDYKIFKGWMLNGSNVDIANTLITSDTTFVANITYRFDVNFVVDENIVDTIIVSNGECSNTTITPSKEHYNFVGWSVDGANVVSLDAYPITKETNFVAIFEIQKHSVKIASSWIMMGTPTILYETEIEYGTKIGKLQYTPTKDDYKCIGYQTYSMMASDIDIENYVVVADVMFVPKWERTVSVVKVYDNDTLLYSHKYNTGDTFTLSSIIPLGRENMRFIGWDRWSDSAHTVHFQGDVNASKTMVEKLGTETATNKDLTYYAYYEHLCMGKFQSDDGNHELELTYDILGSYAPFTYKITSKNSDDPYLDKGTWKVDAGTFINETISGVKVQGVYDKNSDTWTITIYVNNVAATPYALKRVAHTCGVSGYTV